MAVNAEISARIFMGAHHEYFLYGYLYKDEISKCPLEYFQFIFECIQDKQKFNANERRTMFLNLVDFYEEYKAVLEKYYIYFPNEFKYVNRFQKVNADSNDLHPNFTGKSNFNLTSAKQNVPSSSGLYLIGQCAFNSFTYEEFYWIKVGKASDISKRMAQYATHSPMIWKQDFLCADKNMLGHLESACHSSLSKIAIGTGEKSQEWFRVSREDYLEICEKQFKYFFPNMKS